MDCMSVYMAMDCIFYIQCIVLNISIHCNGMYVIIHYKALHCNGTVRLYQMEKGGRS